ncbi:MAG: hypothetical protein ACERKV_12745 [Clostridiaceae bacterium]
MDNNDFEKILKSSITEDEFPDFSLILNTRKKIYITKERKTEKIAILFVIVLCSILFILEFIISLFMFKINPLIGIITYLTLVSFQTLLAFICYYYKNSIINYLEN